MQITPVSLPSNFNLFLISDLHKGTVLHHEHGLQQAIDMVASAPNNFMVILGDLAEAITIDDKRYDRGSIDPRTPVPLLQYQSLATQFKPIKKRILTILEGNHDWIISNKYGNGIKDILCKELEVPFGTYSCKLIVNDKKGRLMFKAFLTHGYGGVNSTADDPVRREANMQLMLKRKLNRKAGDTYLMASGHTHKLLIKPPIKELYLIDDGLRPRQRYNDTDHTSPYIHPDLRWYVNTGSFYKLFTMGESGYAERHNYDPNELGFVIVRVEGGKIQNVEKVILD